MAHDSAARPIPAGPGSHAAHFDDAFDRALDRRRLEAAVTGFSVAVIVGFDLRGGSPMDASTPENRSDLPVHELGRSVASVLDDHHIKFADACVGLAHRRPEFEPLIGAMLTARLAG